VEQRQQYLENMIITWLAYVTPLKNGLG